MGYVGGGRLGDIGGDIQSAAAAVKGITQIVSSARGFFDSGKSTDQQRQDRANFFGQSAMAGSITAARYLLGGLQNTASHEQPYYQTWINTLSADTAGVGAAVLAQAEAQGAKWAAGVADPYGTNAMMADVKTDLAALGKAAPVVGPTPGSTGTGTGTGAHTLPTVTTTAPFNWTPFVIAGGAGLAAVLLLGRSRGRR